MAEITYNGYVVKTENQWFNEERGRYLAIDSGWNLDPSTPDGLKLASDSEIWATLDEVGLQAYNSKDPSKASGQQLDILYYLTTGKTRPQGTPSTVKLSLTGINGTVIPQGSIVESEANQSKWVTDVTVAIASGVAEVSATCDTNGDTQASIGDITKIKTPVGGWQSVTNNEVATAGTNPDTDAEIRERRNRSVATPGNNQLDSMVSLILSTEGVRRVSIPENFTNAVDTNGLPAHSIAPIVDGGSDEDVALSIYLKKNPGCALFAVNTPVVVPVTSPVTGNSKDITFSRPDYIDIDMDIVVKSDGTLPSNVDTLITQSILEYVGGDLLSSSCGFNSSGFDIGEDVPVSRMFTPINQVIGQYGNSYIETLNLNGDMSNVDVLFNQLARFSEANIKVTIS